MYDDADIQLQEDHRLALKKVREMAMDIAERLHASSCEPEADLGEIASRFARVARAVRQTIWLEARLADEMRRRREAEARDAKENDGEPALPPWIVNHRIDIAESAATGAESRLEVGHLVGRAIAQQAIGPERERLEEALVDRITRNDGGVEFYAESMGELISRICQDLGLSPDWTKLRVEDWRLIRCDTRKDLLNGRRPASVIPPHHGQGGEMRSVEPGGGPCDTGYNPPDPWPRGP